MYILISPDHTYIYIIIQFVVFVNTKHLSGSGREDQNVRLYYNETTRIKWS